MMFTVVGSSFRRLITSKIGIRNVRLFPNLPAANCPLFRSVRNRQIEQVISILTIFSFAQSEPIVKAKITKIIISGQKISKTEAYVPLAFIFEIFSRFFFVEFLTFDSWNFFRGI